MMWRPNKDKYYIGVNCRAAYTFTRIEFISSVVSLFFSFSKRSMKQVNQTQTRDILQSYV